MYSIAIHGGAGTILKEALTPETEKLYRDALYLSVETGSKILSEGGPAIIAVEAALVVLEDCPLFNAGKGAVMNHEGQFELDAAIMDGATLNAGSVAGLKHVKNPVKLAKLVMEHSRHVMLYGEGADELAIEKGLDIVPHNYFFTEERFLQWVKLRDTEKTELDHTPQTTIGTAGVVALDLQGNLAAATSTGGLSNKRYNRIGDTPIIGSGTYANNKTCAVSCTGEGEFFIRAVAAYDVSCYMEYAQVSLEEACRKVIFDKVGGIGGEGGLIAVDNQGHIALIFNTPGMYRGWKFSEGNIQTSIF